MGRKKGAAEVKWGVSQAILHAKRLYRVLEGRRSRRGLQGRLIPPGSIQLKAGLAIASHEGQVTLNSLLIAGLASWLLEARPGVWGAAELTTKPAGSGSVWANS